MNLEELLECARAARPQLEANQRAIVDYFIEYIEALLDGVLPEPDDLAVDRFALEMKKKLAAKREEGFKGWEECSSGYLASRLVAHAVKGDDPVDIGNLAMMVHQRGTTGLELQDAMARIEDKIRDDLIEQVGQLIKERAYRNTYIAELEAVITTLRAP